MADVREESSEDSSDSTSSDNFSIYTETSGSKEDLQNVKETGTSTSSATTHNSRKGKSKSSSKQPTVKRSKRQQSFFAGKAYLKINSLVKTPLHAPGNGLLVFVNKRPYYNIKVRVRINRGSSSFNCSTTNGNATL